MAFAQKIMEVEFSLSQGKFSTGNTHTSTGLRMSARITTPGGEDTGNLELSIYGMSDSDMNQLTVLPTGAEAVGQNTVTVRAGDACNLAVVFNGTITFAYCDATRQPLVCFKVAAIGGHVERIKPAAAVSMQGSQDVADLMKKLAGNIGRGFEGNGVNIKIQNPNLPGSTGQQIAALARMAGVMWTMDGETVAIWKPGEARQGDATTISKATGLVGYPAFTASGLLLTTLFQGTIKFGCKIQVESGLQPACGSWTVTYMEHALDCLTPNGAWFTTLQAGKLSVSDSE